MPHVSIGDADIYYEEQGRGPALMLVPGLGGQGAFWAPQVRDLARDFRVIVHDHRGAGGSTHSRIRYSVDQMAADTVALMDRLGVERAHYVGHSTGGAIGQTIAQDHPDRLLSLVLSATWPGPDPYFRRCFETRKELLLHRGFESYWRASVVMLRPPRWVSAHDAALEEELARLRASAPPPEVLASRIDAIVAFDRQERLGEIRCPTLVVVAADDALTPVHYSEELAARIPGARLAILPTGGHFVPSLEVEAYNRVVGGFLRAQLAPAPAIAG
ncbi:MAG TPA: alpha/beta fold hydrolase [Methylomirabilota bacterium]|nr:alpha/beta fold hydrolase [Methylomirabilota bacterium]